MGKKKKKKEKKEKKKKKNKAPTILLDTEENVRQFIEYINETYDLSIPTGVAKGAPLIEQFLETIVEVHDEDGKPVFVCAQAEAPEVNFGMPPNIGGTLVLRVMEKGTLVAELPATCKDESN